MVIAQKDLRWLAFAFLGSTLLILVGLLLYFVARSADLEEQLIRESWAEERARFLSQKGEEIRKALTEPLRSFLEAPSVPEMPLGVQGVTGWALLRRDGAFLAPESLRLGRIRAGAGDGLLPWASADLARARVLEEGDPQGARDLYANLDRPGIDKLEVALGLGSTEEHLGNAREAVRIYREAQTLHGDRLEAEPLAFSRVSYRLASALEAAGDRRSAARAFLDLYEWLTIGGLRVEEGLRLEWTRAVRERLEGLRNEQFPWIDEESRWLAAEERLPQIARERRLARTIQTRVLPWMGRIAEELRSSRDGFRLLSREVSGHGLLAVARSAIIVPGDELPFIVLELDGGVVRRRVTSLLGDLLMVKGRPLEGGAMPLPGFIGDAWGLNFREENPPALAAVRVRRRLALALAFAAAGAMGLAFVVSVAASVKQARLSRLRSDLVSNISHELRGPLSVLRVCAETVALDRGKDPERARHYANVVSKQAERLSRLVDNVLELSALETGKKRLSRRREDLGAIVREVMDGFRPRLEEEGFEVSLEIPRDPIDASVDREGVARALWNLVDNAMKYSGERRRIEVALRNDGPLVALSVRDHGPGIPPPERRAIFERFHRVGNALTSEVRGCGLGLAIVREIVSAHGGRIECRSRVGRGSTFEITLPRDLPEGKP